MKVSLMIPGTTLALEAALLVTCFAPPRILHSHKAAVFRLSSATDAGIELAQRVQPSVALVTPMGVRNIKTRGSGFVVEFPQQQEDYTYLITAAHVAAPGFEIGLSFPGDSTDRPATVMGRNRTLDLALLRIERDDRLAGLQVAPDLPSVGTSAFAHGYPASRLRGPAMTAGIVCGIADGLGLPSDSDDQSKPPKNATHNFDSTVFVVTDAAMSGGMSGGPLTNVHGQVLGVNALIRPDLRALGNYAVSAEEVNSFLQSLAQKDSDSNIKDDQVVASYQLLLFNDPMNKKQRVSSVLEGVANMNGDDANQVMMQAHTTGTGVIRVFQNRTQAEDLCQALRKEDLLVEVQ